MQISPSRLSPPNMSLVAHVVPPRTQTPPVVVMAATQVYRSPQLSPPPSVIGSSLINSSSPNQRMKKDDASRSGSSKSGQSKAI